MQHLRPATSSNTVCRREYLVNQPMASISSSPDLLPAGRGQRTATAKSLSLMALSSSCLSQFNKPLQILRFYFTFCACRVPAEAWPKLWKP